MSEILTEEQVAELFANQMNTQCRVYFEVVGQSHEALRANYDALLQGATAQRVATLMDDADQAQVEIERLKEDNWRLEKERNIAQVLRNDTWVELAALRARIAELEKERDAALELAARREKENRLILRLHKRKQGISDDALQHSIAERDGEKLGRQILAGALEQAVQNGKRCADERDGLRGECAAALGRETAIALERDGLRRAIESAPHGAGCWFTCDSIPRGSRTCDCWKSRALAAVPDPEVQP